MNALLEREVSLRLAEALDPVRFARRLGVEPDPWQADVLRTPADRVILNCCRQSGKSTTSAIAALHAIVHKAGSLVLLLSPSLRQSSELFRKTMALYRGIAQSAPLGAESALRLELKNGSRLISLPGNETTVRGFSGVDLLVVDEAARVEDSLYQAIRPMLATSAGRLMLLSTPFGQRGFFHKTWTEVGEEWLRVKVTAPDCPRIPASFLEQERKELGHWVFDQEYMAEFRENETAAFSYFDIQRAVKHEEVEEWRL